MQLTHRIWMATSVTALVAAIAAAAVYIWTQSDAGSEIAEFAPLDSSCDIQQGTLSSGVSKWRPRRPVHHTAAYPGHEATGGPGNHRRQ